MINKDNFPCFHRLHAPQNFCRIDLKSVTADILLHGGHKYYIFEIHSVGLVQAKGRASFAKCTQGGNHPVIN